jgi:hypothetical protein
VTAFAALKAAAQTLGLLGGASALAGEAGAVGGLTVALEALTGPVGLAIGLIAGLTVAWTTDFGHIRFGVTELGRILAENLGPGLALTVKTAKGHIAEMVQRFNDLFDRVADHSVLTRSLSAYGDALVSGAAPTSPNITAADQAQAGRLLAGVGGGLTAPARNRLLVGAGGVGTGAGPSRVTPPPSLSPEQRQKLEDLLTRQKQAADKLKDALDAAREAALRAQAANSKLGELSPQVAAVDLFGKAFDNLSEAHKKAAIQLAGYRKEEETWKNRTQAAEQAAEARKQAQERLTQALADSRLEFLKAQAINRTGELSKETVALDLLNLRWQDLDKHQRQVVLSALGLKQRAKDLTDETAATNSLSKAVDDLNLKYLALTAKTPLQKFAAGTLGIDYSKATPDQQALAGRAFTMTGNIDARTRVDEAHSSAQSAYVDYLKAQAKADFGENSKSYIALDQFKHSWEQLTPAEKAATAEIQRYQLATAALTPETAKLTDEQKQLISTWEKAGSLAETQFKRHIELTGTTRGLTEVQVALNEALANGDDELALWLASIGDATKANDKLAKDMAQQQKLIQQAASGTAGVVANSLQNIWQHGFKGFFANVIDGFKQMFQQIALDIIRSEIQRKITDALTPKAPGSSGGSSSGLVGELIGLGVSSLGGGGAAAGGGTYDNSYGSHFATGGDVYAGQVLTVGERGSETFVPRTAGTILPHGATTQGAGTTVHVTMNISTPDANSFRRSQGQILGDMQRGAMLAARRGS